RRRRNRNVSYAAKKLNIRLFLQEPIKDEVRIQIGGLPAVSCRVGSSLLGPRERKLSFKLSARTLNLILRNVSGGGYHDRSWGEETTAGVVNAASGNACWFDRSIFPGR